MSTEFVAAPILIHDRIAANRGRTLLLEVVFALAILPTFLHATSYLTLVFGMATMGMEDPVLGARGLAEPRLAILGLAALALVVTTTYLVHRYSTALVLKLTGARLLDPNAGEEPVLSRIIENLCIGSGIPRPRLAVIESTAANAYSTGMDPETATLVVTRGLLTLLDRHELEGVVAQELSQIGNEDVRLGTLMATVVTVMWLPYLILRRVFRAMNRLSPKLAAGFLVGFLLWIVLPMLVLIFIGFGLGFEMMLTREAGPDGTSVGGLMEGLALIALMLVGVYTLIGGPVIGLLLRRAVSRERAFLADADAALLTRYPPGLACALTKIGSAGNASVDAEPSIAHLWIVDPRAGSRSPWLRFLSMHPALDERIETLSRMGKTTPSMLEKAAMDGARYSRSNLG
jgi:heat shock protein HtpX